MTLRRRLLGLLLVFVLVSGVVLSIAVYNKSFSQFVTVRLQAGTIGNQLDEESDVKMRGLHIGSVSDIEVTDEGSELTLRLTPGQAELVPSNVSARFLPKTLFGERFVALEIPENTSSRSLSDGDVITQDQTTDAIELEQALDNLLPVLQAVQPEKLSSTLTAISTALEGRGEPLGQTLSEVASYVGDLNPHLPELQENVRELADFSEELSESAPDLITSLDNMRTTSDTVVEKQEELETLYKGFTDASMDLEAFIETNADNIIGLGETARPTAELLAEYAPEYPCFLGQISDVLPRVDEAFGKGTSKPGLHATLEITTNRGPYKPGEDEPEYEDDRGPRCYDMEEFPDPFPQQPPDGPLQDGSTFPPPARSADSGLNPASDKATAGGYSGMGTEADLANSVGEHKLLAQLLGPELGVSSSEFPGWGSFLVAPLYRGTEVTVE